MDMKPIIEVVNIRNPGVRLLALAGKVVYLGRAQGDLPASPLGNPFYLADANNDVQRKQVIDRFDLYLRKQADAWLAGDCTGNAVLIELERLYQILIAEGVLKLACWCAPKACHADVVAGVLKERFDAEYFVI